MKKITYLINAFFGMLIVVIGVGILSLIFNGLISARINLVNYIDDKRPASFYFQYQSLNPSKLYYNRGELIEFDSIIERYQPTNNTRQDVLYCQDKNSKTVRTLTQIRPEDGTEYKNIGTYNTRRGFYKETPKDAIMCRLCGTLLAYTIPNNNLKAYSYCTTRFYVNL